MFLNLTWGQDEKIMFLFYFFVEMFKKCSRQIDTMDLISSYMFLMVTPEYFKTFFVSYI